ncbi:MAG: ATP-binding protein [Nitrospirales bacterium]
MSSSVILKTPAIAHSRSGSVGDHVVLYPMIDGPLVWFRRLTLAQKFFVSFGSLLLLLGLSLAAILFYLSKINSYVDRHNRITVPAVVTAANMRQTVFQMNLALTSLERHSSMQTRNPVFARLKRDESSVREILAFYRATHAARTHPVLFGMLTRHNQMVLADQEDRLLDRMSSLLDDISSHRETLTASSQRAFDPESSSPIFKEAQSLYEKLTEALTTLIDVHTKIDTEMKLEGDVLLSQARLVILALVILLMIVIATTYRVVSTQIATPLRRLAGVADRVAHGELQAGFEIWPARDEVGELSASLALMLTTLRERTTALERKTRELEAFSYSVAHDLKGPLREIEGFSSLIEGKYSGALDATPRQYLAQIRESALRMTALIDALLKYSRLEQQTLPKSRVNLRALAEHVVASRQIAASSQGVRITIDLPASDVWGEPTSIQQAVGNVLDNALKFSRQEPAEISIGGMRGQGESILWVRDNGIGFDPQHATKLFGLFERLHSSDRYEGTGVGLAIVKLVMEKHEGRAWADSSLGKGSTFYLAFPDSPALGHGTLT